MRQYEPIIFAPSIEEGGVEKNLFLISNFLSKKLKNLTIITANNNKEKYFNKTIHFLSPKSSFFENKNRLIKSLICLLILFRQIIKRKKRVAIISFQGNIFAIIFAIIFILKIIVRSNSSPEGWASNYIKKKLFYLLFSQADIVIVNSKEFKYKMKNLLNINAINIYNPLDTKVILKKSKQKIKFNFFKKNSVNLISVGRLTNQKDHLTLLKAVKKIKDKINLKVAIIGKGKKKEEILNFIEKYKLSNCIRILGYKDNPYPYLRMSDCLVLTSKYEGLPNVLLEAMYLKKFIISSKCPTGPKEILLNGKLGYLFEISDFKALSNLILKYAKLKKINKSYINRTVKNGFKSLDRFNFEKNCRLYLDSINKILT